MLFNFSSWVFSSGVVVFRGVFTLEYISWMRQSLSFIWASDSSIEAFRSSTCIFSIASVIWVRWLFSFGGGWGWLHPVRVSKSIRFSLIIWGVILEARKFFAFRILRVQWVGFLEFFPFLLDNSGNIIKTHWLCMRSVPIVKSSKVSSSSIII